MDKLVLAIDCGTQSIRAMLFNDKGELIEKIREVYQPYFSKEEGYAEQHAELYWNKICSAVKKLKAAKGELWDSIIGVTATVMRDVGICVDKDMRPLRPAILWLDKRKAECKTPLPISSKFLFKVSGMTDAVKKNMVDCKSNWIKEKEPEIWAQTDKYIQLSAYINYKMTSNLVDSVAATIGHLPINYKKRTWMSQNHFQMPIFRMEQEKLYKLVEPGEAIGVVGAAVAAESGLPEGVTVITGGSDKGCETIGTGAIYEGVASLSFGTTATIQITTEKYVEPITFLPAYPAVYPNRFNPEIMVNRGFWMLTWFINEFIKREGDGDICYEKELDKHLSEIPAGCDGLYVEPYWNPSLKYPHARGAMIGFTEQHSKYHMYRAIIEGINFALLNGAHNLEKKAKIKLKALTVSGGGAKSDAVCQITANMFGLPVMRAQTYETSGLGAAISAFVGLGYFADYDAAIKNMVHIVKRFEPDMDIYKKYDMIYNRVYKGTYKKLKSIFKEIKNIKNEGEK